MTLFTEEQTDDPLYFNFRGGVSFPLSVLNYLVLVSAERTEGGQGYDMMDSLLEF